MLVADVFGLDFVFAVEFLAVLAVVFAVAAFPRAVAALIVVIFGPFAVD